MIGTCDSCLKFSLRLIVQTNFSVKRKMCKKCYEAANEVERLTTLSPSQRHAKSIPAIGKKGQYKYFAELESSRPTPKLDGRPLEEKVRDAFGKFSDIGREGNDRD
jgi:hypothetical protein